MNDKPIVYIIAGPNGSGKTTFAREFLPKLEANFEFVNADYLAGGLSPFAPYRAAIEAGKLSLRRIKHLAQERKNFAFESTLAGVTYVHLLKDLKRRGYEIRIYFLWLRDIDLALRRIAERVRHGGHNVPEADVRRRYAVGLRNLFTLYRPLADFLAIVDNSGQQPKMIATGDARCLTSIVEETMAEVERAAGIKVTGIQP